MYSINDITKLKFYYLQKLVLVNFLKHFVYNDCYLYLWEELILKLKLRSEACHIDIYRICSKKRCVERAFMKFPLNIGLVAEFVFLKLDVCIYLQVHEKLILQFLPR